MTAAQLQRYFDQNGLTEGARSCIRIIRASAPAWPGPTEIHGFNGTDKRVVVYAEAPAEDLPWVSALAADQNVLEIYYQPPRFPSSAGLPAKVSAPYFFVLWVHKAGWADCQAEDDLERLALQQPGRYCRDVSGRWRSPIGEAFARPLGLCYRVLTPEQVFPRFAAGDSHLRATLGVPAPLSSQARPPTDPDDFDYEGWFKNQTLPMELAPARVARLRAWLEAYGFGTVQIRYLPKRDKFRVIMRRGNAASCRNDDEAEDWLRRAAEASCGAEPTELIALLTDGQIGGSFRIGIPRTGGRG